MSVQNWSPRWIETISLTTSNWPCMLLYNTARGTS